MERYRRKLVCTNPKCNHAWTFKGKKTGKLKKYVSCPVCHGSVNINQKQVPEDLKESVDPATTI